MSRRSSHGARPHGQRPHRRDVGRSGEPARPASGRVDPTPPSPAPSTVSANQAGDATVDGHLGSEVPGGSAPPPVSLAVASPAAPSEIASITASQAVAETLTLSATRPAPPSAAQSASPVLGGGCTAAQLRRFIKSRAYVPMHELRRRFEINGTDDDVTRVSTGAGQVFVGLPSREGLLLGELLRGGEIGYELSLDPVSPIVIGVYPMRPISRS